MRWQIVYSMIVLARGAGKSRQVFMTNRIILR